MIKNKGSAGVDGMKVSELGSYMSNNQLSLIRTIEDGTYQPQSVLGVEIDKTSGGKRLLGIPTVVDRMIQQAIAQVLIPIFELEFSPYSYGFRPRKGAHQAVIKSLDYINSGSQDIIDLDLKSFFDVVNHDLLMTIFYKSRKDKYLSSGGFSYTCL